MAVDNESREQAADAEVTAGAPAGAIGRSQNQLHVIPEDWHAAVAVIEPLLDRMDPASDATQMLVVAGDVDAAAALATRLAARERAGALRVLAATDARRATRAQRAAPAHALVGTPEVLVSLLRSAVVKLDAVRAVVLAWVDEVDHGGMAALEAVMTEVPKDAARVVLASGATPAVEQLVERYARRARRLQAAGAAEAGPVPLSYVAVGEVARPMAVRRILDALDPETAFIATRSAESRAEVAAQIRALGYGGDRSPVLVGERPDHPVRLVVLYDFPSSPEALRGIVASAPHARVVALVAPRQLGTLRRWAGGALSPLGLPEAAARARSREDLVRDEVRAALESGGAAREVLTLEPLLADWDGIEIAAAVLRLLEAERTRPRAGTGAAAAAEPAAMTRVFLNVGEMDGVRPGDLVGAFTNEAGVSKAEIGRVEIRERHSTVEVATAVANSVVSQITGVTIRGRRVLAKIDEGRERRDSGGARERGGPPRRDRDRSSTRPARRPPTRPR